MIATCDSHYAPVRQILEQHMTNVYHNITTTKAHTWYRKPFIGLLLFWNFCCVPFNWWTRDHEMVITSSRLVNGTATTFNHEVENSSCMNPTRVHRSWSPSLRDQRNAISLLLNS